MNVPEQDGSTADYLAALHRAFDVLCNISRSESGRGLSKEYLRSVCDQTHAAIQRYRRKWAHDVMRAIES